jgi:hypothetical protein
MSYEESAKNILLPWILDTIVTSQCFCLYNFISKFITNNLRFNNGPWFTGGLRHW